MNLKPNINEQKRHVTSADPRNKSFLFNYSLLIPILPVKSTIYKLYSQEFTCDKNDE